MEELDINEYIQEKQKRYKYKENADNDSYALRALKQALQQRLFWSFLTDLGIKENKNSVFYYVNGDYNSISNTNIFLCREKMQPSKWYYKVNEKLPPRIEFTPKHNVSDLMSIESVGHLKLKELQDEYTMPDLCKKYDLNLYQMKNIRYKRLNPLTNKECFKILPPERIVVKLRELINPDYWYIFPDELI